MLCFDGRDIRELGAVSDISLPISLNIGRLFGIRGIFWRYSDVTLHFILIDSNFEFLCEHCFGRHVFYYGFFVYLSAWLNKELEIWFVWRILTFLGFWKENVKIEKLTKLRPCILNSKTWNLAIPNAKLALPNFTLQNLPKDYLLHQTWTFPLKNFIHKAKSKRIKQVFPLSKQIILSNKQFIVKTNLFF